MTEPDLKTAYDLYLKIVDVIEGEECPANVFIALTQAFIFQMAMIPDESRKSAAKTMRQQIPLMLEAADSRAQQIQAPIH
jgi:hypothetical protein